MNFTLDKSSSEKKSPILLPRKQKQLYGGVFSGWFMNDKGQYGPSIVVKCLVTHQPEGMKWAGLEKLTQAVAFLGVKWWYNAKKDECSYPLAFLSAVTGTPPAALEGMDIPEAKELFNESVGNGILFTAYIDKKEDGTLRNAIDKDSFDEPDEAFLRISGKMKKLLEITTDEKDGSRYVTKPLPVYQDGEAQKESAHESALAAAREATDEEIEDEIPFG